MKKAYRERRPRFIWMQRWLNKADMATTYDVYLTRCTVRSTVVLTAAAVAAVALGLLGYVVAASVVAAAGVLSTAAVVAGYIVYPVVVAEQREKEIDAMYPHVLLLSHALSRSGMSFLEVAEVIADSKGVYGEISREFERFRRDVTLYGEDLLTALDRARETTPSSELEDFFDDLGGVVESRTSYSEFIDKRYREQVEEVEDRQQAFLGRLKSFAQAYIVLLFVGPLLALVLLILLSFAGANTLPPIYFIVYVYPFVGVVVAVLALDALESQMGLVDTVSMQEDDEEATTPTSDVYRRYRRSRLRHRIREWSFREAVRRRPPLMLLVSLPLAAALAAAVTLSLDVDLLGLYRRDGVLGTAAFVGLAVVVFSPVAFLYTRVNWFRRRYVDRLPHTLESFRESLLAGVTPVEACMKVSENIDSAVADDFARVYREVEVTGEPLAPFMESARRRGVGEFTLTMKTLVEAMRANNDVNGTVEALAESARSRVELRNERRTSMELYTVVILLGLSVFVVTAVFLELFFLPHLEDVGEATEGGFLSPAPIPTETYSTVLYHATLVQATVNGLFVGKLRNGSLRSGVVIAVSLVVLSTVPFLLL